jgi:exosortase
MMAGSTQTVPTAAEPAAQPGQTTASLLSRVPKSAWGPFAVVLLLLFALYLRVGIKLVVDWYNIADYSHGFLVPLFSAFLLWDKRSQIAATPIRPSWAGVPFVALGLLILIFGIYGVDLFTTRFSFVVLVASLVWTFFGSAMLRTLRFPILVLLLAIPFPAIIFNQITFPLQLMASRLASMILPLLGVPTLQEGNVIQLPIMKLEVAEACSGIRSLMSLFTLAVFYGYFLEKTTARRIILALASIPIAVAANVARIVGTGLCVQYWDPSKALGFFHEFSGWVMFLVSLGCLYLVHKGLGLLSPARKEAA